MLRLPQIKRQVPFVPSGWYKIETMIDLAEVKPGDKVADLGSGDGRVIIEFAKVGAQAHGYEIDGNLVIEAESRILEEGLEDRAFVHWQNYWQEDLSEYRIITVYGMDPIMQKLEDKLFEELRPGTKVISNLFPFPIWQYVERRNNVYLYIIR